MTNIKELIRENRELQDYNEELYRKLIRVEREKNILLNELKQKGNQKEFYLI